MIVGLKWWIRWERLRAYFQLYRSRRHGLILHLPPRHRPRA